MTHPLEPPLGGQRPHEPPQLRALADGHGHAVQHLGGVAAGLALDRGDQADVADVARCASARPRPPIESSIGTPSWSSPTTRPNSLRAGSAASSAIDAQRSGERMPGAQRRRQHLEVVGQLLVEPAAHASGADRESDAHADRVRATPGRRTTGCPSNTSTVMTTAVRRTTTMSATRIAGVRTFASSRSSTNWLPPARAVEPVVRLLEDRGRGSHRRAAIVEDGAVPTKPEPSGRPGLAAPRPHEREQASASRAPTSSTSMIIGPRSSAPGDSAALAAGSKTRCPGAASHKSRTRSRRRRRLSP